MAWHDAVSELKKILLDIRLSIFLLLVFAFASFIPKEWAVFLSIEKLQTEYKQWISFGFIVFFFINIIHLGSWLFRRLQIYRQSRIRITRLRRLTVQEKKVLSEYIKGDTMTIYLSINDGVTNGLVQSEIIWRSASISRDFNPMSFAYNIQDWAWDYLKKHPDLLT